MRLEYKYLVPISMLEKLRKTLRPFINLDEYAESREEKEYKVRSIYYDTMRLDDYRDKLAGLKVRKKIRIRGYNQIENESMVFLEIKRKYENHIFKNRAPLFYKNLEEILQTSDIKRLLIKKKNYLDAQDDAVKFFYILKINNYSPSTLVVYDREAYFSKHDSTLRITFDKNLRSKALPKTSDLFCDKELKYSIPGFFIVEIKFYNGFPKWLQSVLNRYELQRRALSKYTICVDNHPELNKYVYSKHLLIPSPFTSINDNPVGEFIKNAG